MPGQYSYHRTTTLAIPVPQKRPQYSFAPNHRYASSPPDVPESVTTSSGLVPSCGRSAYSATSPSCAGSASGDDYSSSSRYAGSNSGEDYSSSSLNGIDLQEYMQDRFNDLLDPISLDRTLAVQAQSSGLLNAKHRELAELQALAQQRLALSKARLAEGYQDAREVRKDLEWTQKRISSLKSKACYKHPNAYNQARLRYPSPEY